MDQDIALTGVIKLCHRFARDDFRSQLLNKFFLILIFFSDYTCVAVNAGGVMEENISLTFEEPKPVRKS